MRSWLRVALLGLCLGGVARAQQPMPLSVEEQARAHFNLGSNHFMLHEYEAAIADFQQGYRKKPLPLFLYNIAQAARAWGKPDLAIEYYEKYIERETKTDAPELAVALKQLDALKAARAAASRTARVESGPAASPSLAREAPPPVASPRPVWKRGWLWGTLVVIAAAGVGVGLGVGLGLKPTAPSPSLGVVNF